MSMVVIVDRNLTRVWGIPGLLKVDVLSQYAFSHILLISAESLGILATGY